MLVIMFFAIYILPMIVIMVIGLISGITKYLCIKCLKRSSYLLFDAPKHCKCGGHLTQIWR